MRKGGGAPSSTRTPCAPQPSGPRGPVSGSSQGLSPCPLPCAPWPSQAPVLSRPRHRLWRPAQRPLCLCGGTAVPQGGGGPEPSPGSAPPRPPSPPDIRDPRGQELGGQPGRAGGRLGSGCDIGAGGRERNPSVSLRKPTGTEAQAWAQGDRRVWGASPSPQGSSHPQPGRPAGRLHHPALTSGAPAPSLPPAPLPPAFLQGRCCPGPFPQGGPWEHLLWCLTGRRGRWGEGSRGTFLGDFKRK